MQWVGRALSSVSQYYKEINPATLSGAIDVIVVERTETVRPEDASDTTPITKTTLACSPFHVRFGKLSVLRPTERTVSIKINDVVVPFSMKVGDTGEAFFVFETDQDLPADLQTSPLAQPVSDEQDSEEEVEPLDLGDSVAALPADKEPRPSTSADTLEQEKEELEEKHVSATSSILQGAAARAQAVGASAINLAKPNNQLSRVKNAASRTVKGKEREVDSEAEGLGEAVLDKSKAITEESFLADELGPAAPSPPALEGESDVQPFGSDVPWKQNQDSDGAGAMDKDIGSVPRELARAKRKSFEEAYGRPSQTEATGIETIDQVVNSSGLSTYMPSQNEDGERKSSDLRVSEDIARRPSTSSIRRMRMSHSSGSGMAASGELMLDMAGYKTEDAAEAPNGEVHQDASSHPSQRYDGVNGIPSEEEIRAEVQAGGQDVQDETDPDVMALTRALLRFSEVDNKEAGSNGPTPASSLRETLEIPKDPYVFALSSEGHVHTFEIAVCNDMHPSDHVVYPDESTFTDNRISLYYLISKPELLEDRHLYIRYRQRYFGWENGSPALASVAIYRKAIQQSSEASAVIRPHMPSAPQSSGRWRKWWGGRARTTTSDSDLTHVGNALDGHEAVTMAGAKLTPPQSPGLEKTAVSNGLQEALPVSDSRVGQAVEGGDAGLPSADQVKEKYYAKTLRLTSDQLKQLNLKKGMNTMTYTVQSSYSGVAVVTSRIFLWDDDYQVVISDIDGTITKSDALGHVFTMIGRDWTHPGVAKLYTDIARNGYKFMYLTSRAIGQADVTKEYLRGISQNGFVLPEGPVIMSPDRLLTSLHREVVLRKPEVFKMACLRDIRHLFHDRNPFYAGFGNRLTDGLSYRSVEIPSSKIFTIDSYGNVKLELLELAGYTSSYIAMTNLVNETFPPVQRDTQPAYNDFNFWRPSLPQVDFPDFAPPSPALSARSDSSRMSVFRIGSIAGTLSKRASRSNVKADSSGGGFASGTKSPLSASPRSTSPLPLIYRSDDEEEDEVDDDDSAADERRKLRKPRTRHDSMPGSFDNESYLEQVRESLELEREAQLGKGDTKRNDDGDDEGSLDGSLENSMLEEEDDLPDMDFGNVPYL